MPNVHLRGHLSDLLALSREGYVFDCECWGPGLSLPQIQSVLQSAHADTRAPIPSGLGAYVFDCLLMTEWIGSRAARFERRVQRYTELLWSRRPANVSAVGQQFIERPDDLWSLYSATLAAGGEGLMLRAPAGKYKHGRAGIREKIIFKAKPETVLHA